METTTQFSNEYVNSLRTEIVLLKEKLSVAESRLEWFTKSVFGKKSEKHLPECHEQLSLFEKERKEQSCSKKELQISEHTRKSPNKQEELDLNKDSGLRFGDNVEIVEEEIYPKETQGMQKEDYEVIGREISDRIASRETKTFIHRKVFLKVKLKTTKTETSESSTSSKCAVIVKAKVPSQVLERSYMSVSFLADLILYKCLYHMPLSRVHQMLKFEKVHLSRPSLIGNFIKACQILKPIVDAQMISVLMSRVLAMDETPMKVGVDKSKHKMKSGYVWPVYGDNNEIVYHYNESRATSVIGSILKDYRGTLISDGYSAYEAYTREQNKGKVEDEFIHASCWVHARRQFAKLETSVPDIYHSAMTIIAELYKIETKLRHKSKEEIYITRRDESSVVVDKYFDWLKSFDGNQLLATESNFKNAVLYSLSREASMKLFLLDPSVPLDTNHLERENRPFAVGRKNWMFCWTEAGANSLCIAQTLVRTCLLHEINPRKYLIDVLQRMALERNENDDVSDLIPRLWKDSEFAKMPLQCPTQIALDKLKSGASLVSYA